MPLKLKVTFMFVTKLVSCGKQTEIITIDDV